MNTIWDVLRRVVDSKPFTEAEQALAHKIIGDHEAANTPEASSEADSVPNPSESE